MNGVTQSDLYAILGIFAGMLVGFYAILRFVLNQSAKDRHELSSAIRYMGKSSEKVASTTAAGFDKLTKSSDRTADEAKARNGHLAELIIESTKTNQQLADNATATITTAIQTIGTQKIEHQIIGDRQVN